MDEIGVAAFVLIIVGISFGVGCAMGSAVNSSKIANECAAIGKTIVKDKILECKFEVTK